MDLLQRTSSHNTFVQAQFSKVLDENRFELYTRPEYVASGNAVTFTGIGGGNAHKLTMRKSLSKTIIGLDGVVQQPVTFTSITHNLGIFDGFTHNNGIGIGLSQFVLSGIGSVARDFLKIDDEHVKVTEVDSQVHLLESLMIQLMYR